MNVTPKGENIRKAVKWISEIKKYEKPDASNQSLVEEASMKFNLSPSESEFLFRFLRGEVDAPEK